MPRNWPCRTTGSGMGCCGFRKAYARGRCDQGYMGLHTVTFHVVSVRCRFLTYAVHADTLEDRMLLPAAVRLRPQPFRLGVRCAAASAVYPLCCSWACGTASRTLVVAPWQCLVHGVAWSATCMTMVGRPLPLGHRPYADSGCN